MYGWDHEGQPVGVKCFGGKAREARLRWFGRVQRRDSGYGVRMMLRWELAGRRPGRRL